MTRVKVCGITNLADAQCALEAGADALGFIWVPDTPRYLPRFENGTTVPECLPPFVARVAVCRNIEEAPKTLGTQFDTLQYYEHSEQLEVWRGRVRLVHAFRVRDLESVAGVLRSLERFRPDALLLDAYHETQLGGAGVTFDWSLAVKVKEQIDLPILLAGGLNPHNVGIAIEQVRPFAVDISSGIEASAGKKDPQKLRAFFEAVREADLKRTEPVGDSNV